MPATFPSHDLIAALDQEAARKLAGLPIIAANVPKNRKAAAALILGRAEALYRAVGAIQFPPDAALKAQVMEMGDALMTRLGVLTVSR